MSNFLTCSSYQQLIFHTQQRRKSRHHQNHQLNNRITPRKKWKNSGKNSGLMVFRMEISNFFNVYHFLILLSWLTVTSLLCPVWPFGFVLNSFVHLSRGRNSCVSSFKGSAGFGWVRLGSAGLGWARLGWAGLGSAGLGWARLGSAGLGSRKRLRQRDLRLPFKTCSASQFVFTSSKYVKIWK